MPFKGEIFAERHTLGGVIHFYAECGGGNVEEKVYLCTCGSHFRRTLLFFKENKTDFFFSFRRVEEKETI